MRKDDGTGFLPITNQWQEALPSVPVAWKSGSYMQAEADFEFTCTNLPGQVMIRGTGNDGIGFPQQTISVSGTSPASIHYPLAPADQPFENSKIKYYNPFSIQWEISFDGISWHDAGISENEMYVTLHAPVAENVAGDFTWLQSLFYISCKNADGITNDDDMIDAIWNDFTDLSVLRADGEPMKYYGTSGTLAWNLPDIVKTANGACTAWTEFFLAILKVQGFTQVNNEYMIYPHATETECGTIDRFLVKNFSFGTASNACSDMPYTDVYNAFWTTFLYADVTNSSGIPGQSSTDPDAIFAGHVMAYVNGKIYDPSYGVIHASLAEIQSDDIAGYAVSGDATESDLGIDVNADGDIDTSPTYSVLYISDDPDISYLWAGNWTY